MIGGQQSKARRGELRLPLPIGFVYAERDRVVKDPDQSITEAVHLLFNTFPATGICLAGHQMVSGTRNFPARTAPQRGRESRLGPAHPEPDPAYAQ